MRAPFPWFGGKSRAAHLVWGAFGDVPNFVEPFAGSLAVLLARPHEPRIETVNDLDCYLANFWRAVQLAPNDVARWADWPVNEADLHARHRWLVGQAEFRERMKREPDFFDAKIAGWWVWGLCQWIGGGWCAEPNWARTHAKRPAMGSRGGKGFNGKLPSSEWAQRPALASRGGCGFNGKLSQQITHLGGDSGAANLGIHASAKPAGHVAEWMHALAARLRRVRVCCGDWRRILGRSPTECIGVTGILLDPPYGEAAGRDPSLYAEESLTVAADVRNWAVEHGDNPKLRIALCGYEGEHEMPKSWQCVEWKTQGGYASAAGNTENSARERIWFSPACAHARRQQDLFEVRAS